jgi:hypothetical protein
MPVPVITTLRLDPNDPDNLGLLCTYVRCVENAHYRLFADGRHVEACLFHLGRVTYNIARGNQPAN